MASEIVSPAVIDEINILQATYEAMRRSCFAAASRAGHILNDAVMIPGIDDKKQVRIIKGRCQECVHYPRQRSCQSNKGII